MVLRKTEKLQILKSILGHPQFSGGEYLFYCKLCNHHKRKLSINIEKDCWKCWICEDSGYDISRLVKRWGTYADKKQWMSVDNNSVDLSSSLKDEFFNMFSTEKEETIEQVTSLPEEFKSLAIVRKPYDSLEAYSYLKERKLTEQDILNWRIGYAIAGDYKRRVIIPSVNSQGRINFFVARSYTDDPWKYKIPKELNKDIIFNELFINWIDDVVIVEGVFDAIKIKNSIPILGSTLTEKSKLFRMLSKHKPRVYLALDQDAEKKTIKLIIKLMEYGIAVFKIDTSGYKDVAVMPLDVFMKRKNMALHMNASNNLLRYKTLMI